MSSARGKKKEVELPEVEDLLNLADEMNEVLGLDPPLKFGKKATAEEIADAIKEQAEGNIYQIDFEADPDDEKVPFFSEDSAGLLEQLKIEILEGSPEAQPDDKKSDKKEDKKKEDKKSDKKDDKKAGKKDDKKTDDKADKKKTPVEKKYTRDMAVVDAIKDICKKGASFKDIMETSDEIYVENGGRSVPDAVNVNKYTINGLVAFGVLTEKDGIYKLAK